MAHDQSMHIAMRVQAGRTRKAVAQAHIAQSMGPTWCLLRRLSTAPNVARTNAVSVTVAVLQDEISYFLANHKLTHSLTPVHKRIYAAAAPAAAAAAVVVVLTILMARRLRYRPRQTSFSPPTTASYRCVPRVWAGLVAAPTHSAARASTRQRASAEVKD